MTVDVELQDLALQAKSYQPDTLERRMALTQLCQELHWGNKLNAVYGCFNLPAKEIATVDGEARQQTISEICHRIDEYHLDLGSIVTWANGILLEQWQQILQQRLG